MSRVFREGNMWFKRFWWSRIPIVLAGILLAVPAFAKGPVVRVDADTLAIATTIIAALF